LPTAHQGFQSFGLRPRGLLAFAGMMSVLCEGAAVGVGLMFVFVLK
jgi:hypothetical protein